MHECFGFGATNTATTIRAFVAKNIDTKSIATYIPAWVATATATTIRAFVAKNIDTKSIATYSCKGGDQHTHNHSCIRG